jgi:predicted small lipoprotein YifL
MRTIILCGGLFLLAACGTKGPLVMPPAPPAKPSAPAPQPAPVDNSTAAGAVR